MPGGDGGSAVQRVTVEIRFNMSTASLSGNTKPFNQRLHRTRRPRIQARLKAFLGASVKRGVMPRPVAPAADHRPFARFAGLVLALFVLQMAGARAATRLTVSAESALGGGLIRGRWQPLLVTLTNGAGGDALPRGEVQVILEDANMPGRLLGTATRSVSLPGGPAGVAQAMVYVRVPDSVVPNVFVQVADASTGEIVARRRMDKLPILGEQLSLVALSDQPDALAYLRGRPLGVALQNGALRPYDEPSNDADVAAGQARARFRSALQPPSRAVVQNPVTLPDRSAGYDNMALVYLGDIAPDTLSDAQVGALRTWVASGGLLVCGGSRLQTDERFRAFLPARWGQTGILSVDPLAARYHTGPSLVALAPLAPVPGRNARPFLGSTAQQIALAAPLGRGTIVALGFDAASADFAGWPGRELLWRDVARQNIAPPSILQTALDDSATRWNGGGAGLSSAVLRAPGLRAPGFGAIGAFLLAYLVLLVPANYIILKRLDRRELTWLTVPVLVILFSGVAYGFGYKLKGGDLRLNTASVVEMAAGSGQASVRTSIGLFSPRRTSYQISLADPEALFFDPQEARAGGGGASQNDYAPLVVSQNAGAAQTRGTDISMWAMRVLNARTSVSLGRGVDARLRVSGNDVVGEITNRTGRDLSDVSVLVAGQHQTWNVLRDNERQPVRLPGAARFLNDRWRNPFPDTWQNWWNGNNGVLVNGATEATRTREAIRRRVKGALYNGVVNGQRFGGQTQPGALPPAPTPILVTAWNDEPLLPVRVDGQNIQTGENVNLLIVHVPLAGRKNAPIAARPIRASGRGRKR